MLRNQGAIFRPFWLDQVLGGTFILYSLRIPINGIESHSHLWFLNALAFLLVSALTLPLIYSLRIGAWIQLLLQTTILVASFQFRAHVGLPQLLALLLGGFSLTRLARWIGPKMRSIRFRQQEEPRWPQEEAHGAE